MPSNPRDAKQLTQDKSGSESYSGKENRRSLIAGRRFESGLFRKDYAVLKRVVEICVNIGGYVRDHGCTTKMSTKGEVTLLLKTIFSE